MPSMWISQFYMEKVHSQIADTKRFYVDFRKVIDEMYGPPPGRKGFDLDMLGV